MTGKHLRELHKAANRSRCEVAMETPPLRDYCAYERWQQCLERRTRLAHHISNILEKRLNTAEKEASYIWECLSELKDNPTLVREEAEVRFTLPSKRGRFQLLFRNAQHGAHVELRVPTRDKPRDAYPYHYIFWLTKSMQDDALFDRKDAFVQHLAYHIVYGA